MNNYGANDFRTLNVPADGADGTPLLVKDLAPQMTFSLAGTFTGYYQILGTQGDQFTGSYSPLCQWSFQGKGGVFNSGLQGMCNEVNANVAYVKVRRRSADLVTINVAGQVVCACTPLGEAD